MKALVYTGAQALEFGDWPDAEPQAGEALIRVESVGICGSDMHAYLGHDERRPAPLVLGHEAAGTIVEGPNAGSRVTVNPLVTCGECAACRSDRNNLCPQRQIISMPPRHGAFAEYVAMPVENLVVIPDGVSSDTAALAEPMACGWHAVRLAAHHNETALGTGQCVVLGGGAIGLGAALCLRARGATRIAIAETNTRRHPALNSAGPFAAYDPRQASPVADGTADVVIDAVGLSATRAMASRLARPGGVIVHIGLGDNDGGLDVRRLTLQEIAFTGTYTYTPQDFRDTAAAIFDGSLGSLDWFETRPLSEGARAFADIVSGKAATPKIILNPHGKTM